MTDDERREVARRLRYVGERGAPEWATTACCIAECIGEDDYPIWKSSAPLFGKLADLIEPEPERTCRPVLMDWTGNPPYYTGGMSLDAMTMGCSECGCPFRSGTGNPPNYCHNCGAKVMSE